MAPPVVTHVLLDFFGTLVGYSRSRTEQGYHAAHTLVRVMGADVGYPGFLEAWAAEWTAFGERSGTDDREFSMDDVAAAVLTRLLGREPDPAETIALAQAYLAEWNAGVIYPLEIPDLVATLASRYRLAVVSNTHDADLVPRHLAAMGIATHFSAVVTSAGVGWRKPHPAIYAEALRRLDATAEHAVFAGDNYTADFAGPEAVGLAAFLIDPDDRHGVPPGRRLRSLLDLPARLASYEAQAAGTP